MSTCAGSTTGPATITPAHDAWGAEASLAPTAQPAPTRFRDARRAGNSPADLAVPAGYPAETSKVPKKPIGEISYWNTFKN